MIGLASGTVHRAPTTLWDDATTARELRPGRLRIGYGTMRDPGQVGTVFEQRDDYRDTPGGLIWQSERTDLVGLDLHFLHGFGIVSQFTRDVAIIGLRMRPSPGTWRRSVGFADFLHFSGTAGQVQVLGNLFDNPHDDPINIHGTYLQVAAIDRARRSIDLRYMHPQTAGFPQFRPGDHVRFVNRGTLLPLTGIYVVRAVDGPTGTDRGHDLTRMTIGVDRALPADLAVDDAVAENIDWTPQVRIAGNTFRDVPTRGVLVTTPRRTVIERNLFQGITMSSVYVSGDADGWYESGGVNGLTVRNNVFERPSSNAPVVLIQPTNNRAVAGRTIHRNVDIVANRFTILSGTQLLSAKSVTGLRFRENLVTRALPTSPEPAPRPLFSLQDSADVAIVGNRYAAGLNRRIMLTGMSAAAVTSKDGTRINIDAFAPPGVDDQLAAVVSHWSGVSFPPSDAELNALAVVGSQVGSVTARFDVAEGGTRIAATFNDDTIANPAQATCFALRPGANTFEVRAYAGEAARTYRWTLIADRPGSATVGSTAVPGLFSGEACPVHPRTDSSPSP